MSERDLIIREMINNGILSVTICGTVYRNGKKIKGFKNKKGYVVHCMSYKNKVYSIYQHRIVAIKHIPFINGKNLINHKNGVKSDNSIDNLEWVNHKENTQHAIVNGLFKSNDVCFRMNRIRRKLIINTETGIFYNGSMEAATSKGLNRNTLLSKLNGNRTNETPFMYV